MINSFPSDNTVFRKFLSFVGTLLSNTRLSCLQIQGFSASLRFDTTMRKSTLPTTIRSMSLCPVSLDRATEPLCEERD